MPIKNPGKGISSGERGRLKQRKQTQMPGRERGGNGIVYTQERWLGRAGESLEGGRKAPE